MVTYIDGMRDNPPTPSYDANMEIEALLSRSSDRYNAFRATAYQNGAPGLEWQHDDRTEMLAEAQWCETRAQTLMMAEQTKLLSLAFGLGHDVGMLLDRINDNTAAIYKDMI